MEKWNVPVSEETKERSPEPEEQRKLTEEPKQIESKEKWKNFPIGSGEQKKEARVSLLDKHKKNHQKIEIYNTNLCGRIKVL